jgi:hypothetical protein
MVKDIKFENCYEMKKLIEDLQNCVAVRFSTEKQCQLLGKTTKDEGNQQILSLQDIGWTKAKMATKSCVKVFFLFFNI